MKEKKELFLIGIIFITLIIMCIGMEYYTTKLKELEKSVNSLQEDVQIQRDIFASYLNNTLSKDIGGE